MSQPWLRIDVSTPINISLFGGRTQALDPDKLLPRLAGMSITFPAFGPNSISRRVRCMPILLNETTAADVAEAWLDSEFSGVLQALDGELATPLKHKVRDAR